MLSKTPDDRPTAKKILQSPFIKRHIMQLVEKTKVKYENFTEKLPSIDFVLSNVRCQNQTNSSASTSVNVLPPPPSVTPPLSSSPPRASSVNDAKLPHSSASSPSSKKPPSNRFSNHHNSSALPSYPPLPPSSSSYQRPSNAITPSSSSGSSSSADASRSLPSVDASQASNARARRRDHIRQNNQCSVADLERDNPLISKVSGKDTLQRRSRDKQINNHLKQYQPLSSDDELPPHPSPAIVVDIHPFFFYPLIHSYSSGCCSNKEIDSTQFSCIFFRIQL